MKRMSDSKFLTFVITIWLMFLFFFFFTDEAKPIGDPNPLDTKIRLVDYNLEWDIKVFVINGSMWLMHNGRMYRNEKSQ